MCHPICAKRTYDRAFCISFLRSRSLAVSQTAGSIPLGTSVGSSGLGRGRSGGTSPVGIIADRRTSLLPQPVPSAPAQRKRHGAESSEVDHLCIPNQRIIMRASKRPSRPHLLHLTRKSARQRAMSSNDRRITAPIFASERTGNDSARAAGLSLCHDHQLRGEGHCKSACAVIVARQPAVIIDFA